MPTPQGRYFMLTIPVHLFMPYLPPDVQYIKGQIERGHNTEYLHWQIIVYFSKKVSCAKVKSLFGDACHIELTRSEAAEIYVWKEDSRVGHQFELGKKSIKRNSDTDWDKVRQLAESGDFKNIPSDIYIRSYNNLKKIYVDSLKPTGHPKEVFVYWGKTGTGKSRRAWEEASFGAYPKDPCTKWWCGYTGQSHVVIDEFRGQIGISHLLRWFDRYPTVVETKGSATILSAERIWLTSNLDPKDWYPDLDEETYLALRRRFTSVTHFN